MTLDAGVIWDTEFQVNLWPKLPQDTLLHYYGAKCDFNFVTDLKCW